METNYGLLLMERASFILGLTLCFQIAHIIEEKRELILLYVLTLFVYCMGTLGWFELQEPTRMANPVFQFEFVIASVLLGAALTTISTGVCLFVIFLLRAFMRRNDGKPTYE